ncbi:hypothetical protein HYC85_018802 [Camellia sinensis]|uniref:TAFII28-like protein domain-containing protein n=1 Tax=Camellia sinensis TaxID=4442 RepID=A0A7J7GWU1_CAMSI|nr:hypothetical protein HYC85_018802 [Camellia sinensis]
MKQSKDPFEVAFEELDEESPPDSPLPPDGIETQTQIHAHESAAEEEQIAIDSNDKEDVVDIVENTNTPSVNTKPSKYRAHAGPSVTGKMKEEDDEEEEENMDIELGKLSSTADPHKKAKMQSILSQFTEEQMSRYESFRRSGFQKSNMKRSETKKAKWLTLAGSIRLNFEWFTLLCIVFAARIVMAERKESGPIRPCHIREAYRRLKLEGKLPKRSVPRLFR